MQSIELSNAEDIANFAYAEFSRSEFSGYLKQFGRLLYSGADTVSAGDIYLLGLNPAGSSDDPNDWFEKDLFELPSRKQNAYIDEAWCKGVNRPSYPPGDAPLQIRVRCILEYLGIVPSHVCASNLVFIGTEDASGIKEEWVQACWKVHEKILDIVRPKFILCYGNSDFSPYGFLRTRFLRGLSEDSKCANHGTWKVKGFAASINRRPVYIAGVPHLSRYDITSKNEVLTWLKKKFDLAKPNRS